VTRPPARSVCRLMHHNIVITTTSYVVKPSPSVVSHAGMTAPSHGEHLVGRVAVSASLPRSHPGRTHNPSCRPALGGPSHDPRVFIPRSCQGIFWGRTTHGCQPPPPFFSRGHSGQNVRNSESVLNLRQRWQSYKQKFHSEVLCPGPHFRDFSSQSPTAVPTLHIRQCCRAFEHSLLGGARAH